MALDLLVSMHGLSLRSELPSPGSTGPRHQDTRNTTHSAHTKWRAFQEQNHSSVLGKRPQSSSFFIFMKEIEVQRSQMSIQGHQVLWLLLFWSLPMPSWLDRCFPVLQPQASLDPSQTHALWQFFPPVSLTSAVSVSFCFSWSPNVKLSLLNR